MLERIRQTLPLDKLSAIRRGGVRMADRAARLWRGRRPTEDPLVKVAGTIHRVEVEVWSAALQRQGISATVRQRGAAPSAGSGRVPREAEAPPGPPGWEVWVRASDEPRARLILGLSGHSVSRLPRKKPEET